MEIRLRLVFLFCFLFVFGAVAGEGKESNPNKLDLLELNNTIKIFTQVIGDFSGELQKLPGQLEKYLSLTADLVNSLSRQNLETQKKVEEQSKEINKQGEKIIALQTESSALRKLLEQSLSLKAKKKDKKFRHKKRSNSEELEKKEKLEKN